MRRARSWVTNPCDPYIQRGLFKVVGRQKLGCHSGVRNGAERKPREVPARPVAMRVASGHSKTWEEWRKSRGVCVWGAAWLTDRRCSPDRTPGGGGGAGGTGLK